MWSRVLIPSKDCCLQETRKKNFVFQVEYAVSFTNNSSSEDSNILISNYQPFYVNIRYSKLF